MKMSKAAVVIPLYKVAYSEYERVSLVQCCKVLQGHPFVLVCPEGLNVGAYEEILKQHTVKYKIEQFPSESFASVEKYSELLLGPSFYKKFGEYEYILLYQLDAYVFRDELDYWCDQGYDYIGAPWFEGFGFCTPDSKMLDVAGNGGFSLRRIGAFVDVLNVASDKRGHIKQYISSRQNEDMFFANYGPELDNHFKIAPPEVAMRFSFECLPEKLYEMTGRKLPFGCHAWERYNMDFWKDFIHLESRDFEKEFRLTKSDLEAAKTQLHSVAADLEKVREEKELIRSEKIAEIEVLRNELARIQFSREWKAAVFLQKTASLLAPKGGLRRKIASGCWAIAKLFWGICFRAAIKIKEVWFTGISYIYRIQPKKKRKINVASKKIVYVGHSYHNKTKSTKFLIDYLTQSYDVKIISDESWRGDGQQYPDLSFIDDSYLGVIFFQNLPSSKILKSIKNDNILFFSYV